jgi:DNA replication protein DnaC
MNCPKLSEDFAGFKSEENLPSVNNKTIALQAGVPKKYLDCTFDNTVNCISDEVKYFAKNGQTKNGKKVVIIFGGNGTGKTRTASCAMNYRIQEELPSGLFISCKYQICPMIRASRNFKADRNEYQLLQDFYKAPFVVIDDAGKGDDLVISKMFLSCVLSAKYDYDLPVLVTTNLTKSEFSEFVGKDVNERLSEIACSLILNDRNYRLG